MRGQLLTLPVVLFAAVSLPVCAHAQQPAQQPPPAPGVIVVSSNKCPFENLAKINAWGTKVYGPIKDNSYVMPLIEGESLRGEH